MKGFTMRKGNIDPLLWIIVFVIVGWLLFGCATVPNVEASTRGHATMKIKSCRRLDILLFYRCQAEVMDFCRDNGLEKNCWEAY